MFSILKRLIMKKWYPGHFVDCNQFVLYFVFLFLDSGIDSSQEKRTPEPDVSSPVFKEAILTCMEHDNIPIVLEEKKVKKTKKLDKMQSNLSRKEVDNLLDNASLKTMDGCLKILAQLNVREVMQESEYVFFYVIWDV